MTDNEIVKAFEKCIEEKLKPSILLMVAVLDLINRQKAENLNLTSDLTSLQNDLTSAKTEIERLNAEINRLLDTRVTAHSVEKQLKTAKSEAYREFAERVKAKLYDDDGLHYFYKKQIDNILKELEGDNGQSRPPVPTSEKGGKDK